MPIEPTMQPLPVRTRLTVLRDGSTSPASLVYCEAEGRSVPLSRCATCGSGGEVTRDPDGSPRAVACSRFTLRSTPPPANDACLTGASPPLHVGALAGSASQLPVGLALTRGVICVRYDVPIASAARSMACDPSAYGAPVVDDGGRFVGLLARATAMVALSEGESGAVAGRMALPTASVDERASLDAAFAAMGARRARELTVVNAARQVIGSLRDLDALRFVAYVSRTGLRPPSDRIG